jgi:hypothetical protein
MKQGRKGGGGSKALRGYNQNLRVLRSRVRQTRCGSLPVARALKGRKTSRESAFPLSGRKAVRAGKSLRVG